MGTLVEEMDIKELTAEMDRFVSDKGWYDTDSPRPQTQRNLAASLAIEAAEVLEYFQWEKTVSDTEALGAELADVGLYLLQLARVCEIDLEKAMLAKLRENYGRNWE